jgi:membrane protein YqaA with SNARE-associated domain
MSFLEPLTEWLMSWSSSPYAVLALSAASFLDSVLIPVPPEPLLIAMSVARRALPLPYSVLATGASVLGALLDYYVGRWGGRPLAERLVDKGRLDRISGSFQRHNVWVVGLAAFTPLPYSVFSLAAGLAHLKTHRFVLASLVGRGARFFGISAGVYLLGDRIEEITTNYLGLASLVLALILVGLYVLGRYLERRVG